MICVLCLAGSARAASLNVRLARCAAARAEHIGCSPTALDMADYPLPLYDGDLEAEQGLPEAALALADVFRAHDAVFLASPEYNAGITPLLKNAIDWLSRVRDEGGSPYPALSGSVYALGSASPGGFGGARGLMMVRQVLATGLGLTVIGPQTVVPQATGAFDEDGALVNARTAESLDRTMTALVATARALKS